MVIPARSLRERAKTLAVKRERSEWLKLKQSQHSIVIYG